MLYINTLAVQVTDNMMSGETAIALGRHTEQDSIMSKDCGDWENSVLVFLVFKRMTGAVWRSAMLAAWKSVGDPPSSGVITDRRLARIMRSHSGSNFFQPAA